MKDSDLLFNILTAAALGVVIILAPTTARTAADQASGLYIGAELAQSDVNTGCGVPGGVTTSCDTTNTAWKAYLGSERPSDVDGRSELQILK